MIRKISTVQTLCVVLSLGLSFGYTRTYEESTLCVRQCDVDGNTPSEPIQCKETYSGNTLAQRAVLLWNAVDRGDTEDVQRYVSHDTVNSYIQYESFIYVHHRNRQTVLHNAVLKGFTEIAKILLKNGAYVDTYDQGRITPLHIAALRGDVGMVTILLSYNASLQIKDRIGKTPLLRALQHGHITCAKMLLPNTPRNRLSFSLCNLIYNDILLGRWVVVDNTYEIANFILVRNALCMNTISDLNNVLHRALITRCVPLVELMLSIGARVYSAIFEHASARLYDPPFRAGFNMAYPRRLKEAQDAAESDEERQDAYMARLFWATYYAELSHLSMDDIDPLTRAKIALGQGDYKNVQKLLRNMDPARHRAVLSHAYVLRDRYKDYMHNIGDDPQLRDQVAQLEKWIHFVYRDPASGPHRPVHGLASSRHKTCRSITDLASGK